jgi:hypothetical protein
VWTLPNTDQNTDPGRGGFSGIFLLQKSLESCWYILKDSCMEYSHYFEIRQEMVLYLPGHTSKVELFRNILTIKIEIYIKQVLFRNILIG